jgi:hypothetical protein
MMNLLEKRYWIAQREVNDYAANLRGKNTLPWRRPSASMRS